MNKFSYGSSSQGTTFKSILVTLGMFLMLAAIPVGVYLAQNPTNFLPRASTVQSSTPQTGFLVEMNNEVPVGEGEIPVSIILRSDLEEANLFVANIRFDPSSYQVKKILTSDIVKDETVSSSTITKWIQKNFDNKKGEITLVGAVPNPGLKTSINQKTVMATVILKNTGSSQRLIVEVSEQSAIFNNAQNRNIFLEKNNLIVDSSTTSSVVRKQCQSDNDCERGTFCAVPALASGSAQPSALYCQVQELPTIPTGVVQAAQEISSQLNLTLESPKGGEIYSFYQPLSIKWISSERGDLLVMLYRNDIFYGTVAEIPSSQNGFMWNPAASLPIAMVNSDSLFQIGLGVKGSKGEDVLLIVSNPFSISANKEVRANSTPATYPIDVVDINKDKQVNYQDISSLLSAFGRNGEEIDDFDINKDGSVNDLDIFFTKKHISGN